MTSRLAPRIALIHALEESVAPARAAFAQLWPEAFCFDLLDTSLSVDRAEAGRLDETMMSRFLDLARYASCHGGKGGRTAGILFTCSAFGPAIDAVKSQVGIPVLRPNEAAFAAALRGGSRFLVLVSFEASRASLEVELRAMAEAIGKPVEIKTVLVEGALAALQSGDGARHDELLADAAAHHLGPSDTIILGQFSLARALSTIENRLPGVAVLATPHSAVNEMRKLVARQQHQS